MKKFIVLIIILVVIGVGYFVWHRNSTVSSPEATSSPAETMEATASPEPALSMSPVPTTTRQSKTPAPKSVSAPVTHGITIQNFAFAQPSITIKKGDSITWSNRDSAPHTVTGDNGGPSSPTINPGQSYSFTFNTVGTFKYHCSFHPSMLGTVVVTQ